MTDNTEKRKKFRICKKENQFVLNYRVLTPVPFV